MRGSNRLKDAFKRIEKMSEVKWFWLLPFTIFIIFFMFIPVAHMFIYSFYATERGFEIIPKFTLENYIRVFSSFMYYKLFAKSLLFTIVTVVVCVAVAYPCAYYVSREVKKEENKLLILFLVSPPFFAGELMRIVCIGHVLGPRGLINRVLIYVGLPPIQQIGYTNYSVVITMIYSEIAFMFIMIYLSFLNFDFKLIDVAKVYGASNFRAFKEVTWPLTLPGVFVGTLVVLIPTLAHYASVTFVGGPESGLFGNVVINQFESAGMWTIGATLGSVLTMVTLAISMILYFFARKAISIEWGL